MRRGLRRLAQAVLALVWASGAAWLVLHHWAQREGAFGPEPSQAEPWALRVHGVAATATVALLGLLYGVHVAPGWRARRRRWSGGALFASGVALALSGDLLYYLADEDSRAAVALAHWVVGLAALPLFVAHRWRRGHTSPVSYSRRRHAELVSGSTAPHEPPPLGQPHRGS
ncbi:hypothetical protein K7957_07955 [Sphingomonas yunnanensis]|uniref:hypothetical protein n=1 Tax=Sphingomonas yunnanensis TaxID=310400 RepID=UPI001CA67A6A|nr:hypothetical protein [Sphingomonas yunnanensis]MBY9062862.1 hypothetical protein [Sphingomonas yunnanensis]